MSLDVQFQKLGLFTWSIKTIFKVNLLNFWYKALIIMKKLPFNVKYFFFFRSPKIFNFSQMLGIVFNFLFQIVY